MVSRTKSGQREKMHSMHGRKSPERTDPAALEKIPTEILVARGRSFEPFVKTFVQSGENVSSLDLGTLVGVFEVDERSEDSAYIVNFLASVAKKEYFGNPRRGPIESFEAALHKVNLALAELVKHGNIAWLGSLHGAIGAFEKNGMHFSATGQGAILLLREGDLADIGEGLASDEASAHPIKTFTEISSGRLLPDDRIIFSSPELLKLFTKDSLLKNASRMDGGRFDQFLKTALVNELDMAGTIVMHIKQSAPLPKKSPERRREEAKTAAVSNVFSQSAFVKKPGAPETVAEAAAKAAEAADAGNKEYVDSKTGHIYIQGNSPAEPAVHPIIERAGLFIQELSASFRASAGTRSKWFRRLRKQSSIASAEIAESFRLSWDRMVSALKRHATERKRHRGREEAASETDLEEMPAGPVSQEIIQPATELPNRLTVPVTRVSLASDPVPEEAEIPLFIREKLDAFYKKERMKNGSLIGIEASHQEIVRISITSGKAAHIASIALRAIRPAAIVRASSGIRRQAGLFGNLMAGYVRKASSAIPSLPMRQRMAMLGTAIALIGGAVTYAAIVGTGDDEKRASAPASAPVAPAEAPAYADEKNVRILGDLPEFLTRDGILGIAALDGLAYAISPESIIDIAGNREYRIPERGGRIKLSASMDDLRLIFLYTDQGKLFAWSPISRAFAENALALPQGSSVEGIGTYLTYLYVLDSANGQIYRFPRADGGFGSPTGWLRERSETDENAGIAVSESIFVSPDGTSVNRFFRGREEKRLESPSAPLSVTSLASRPDASAAYALDAANGRIVAWNKDGDITAQYFSKRLRNARSIAWNSASNELLIAADGAILSLKP